jgi:hypothetical protein
MAFVASGCAAAAGRDATLQPLVAGAEQHLAVDWRPEPRADGAIVWGYVTNHSPYTFDQVRVLVEALEPTGQILDQRVVWAPGLLGSWGRNYFEAPMIAAHSYRVRVFSYDRVESDGRHRRLLW